MVTVDTNQTSQPGTQLKLESLTHIDLSKLTQSELHSLSLCSSATFDLHDASDLVIPNIDPSLFNESSGSRRQTFSHRFRHRSSSSTITDPTHLAENTSIVNCLKQLINRTENSTSNCNQQIVVYRNDDQALKGKRKRIGEHKKVVEIDERIEFKIVDGNGEVVDFMVLEEHADDLFEAELTRRTVAVESEELGLEFFRGLEGQWCSRRKKRRIVDAGMFGDWLPVGWKLVLALRRRDGVFSVYCRTFMSPSGKHFPSCKDVAFYLQSRHGFSESNMPIDQGIARDQQANDMVSGSLAGSMIKPGDVKHNMMSNAAIPRSLSSEAQGKEVSLLDIDSLPEVQVCDTFECHNCNIAFDERESYMQHLLSFHQKTTRRFRLGSSVGKGVIIKDGKFECQFCHKEFDDRRRYNCHVGIHVRTELQRSRKLQGQGIVQKSIQSPTEDAEPSRTSKLDALLQIAHSSFLEASNVGHNDKHNGSSFPNQLISEETLAAGFGHEVSSLSEKAELMVDISLDKDLSKHNSDCIMPDGSSVPIVGDHKKGNNESVVCTNSAKHTKLAEVEHTETCKLEVDRINHGNSNFENGSNNPKDGINKSMVRKDSTKHPKLAKVGHTENDERGTECGNKHGKKDYDVETYPKLQDVNEKPLQSRDAEQSLHINLSFVSIPEGEHISDAQRKIDSVKGSEELKLEEISPLKLNGQGLPSLPELTKDFANNGALEEGFNSFISLGSEDAMLNMTSGHQLTTLCVWCRTEFYHEAIDLEALSDSIGFMCPTCKAKISGHLDSGLSMNSHCF